MSGNASRTILHKSCRCFQGSEDSSSKFAVTGSVVKQYPTTDKDFPPTTYKTNQKTENVSQEQKKTDDEKVICAVDTFPFKITEKTIEKITEQCLCKTKLEQSEVVVKKIRNLKIKKNEAGNTCGYCKRINISGKCRRCEYFHTSCKTSKYIEKEARKQKFRIWLYKVKQLLVTILQRESCKHRVYAKVHVTDELTRLLNELKTPLTVREPDVDYFPSIESLESINESKDILDKVLSKLNSDKLSEDFMPTTTCVCKYLADKMFEKNISPKHEAVVDNSVLPPIALDRPDITDNIIKKDKHETMGKSPHISEKTFGKPLKATKSLTSKEEKSPKISEKHSITYGKSQKSMSPKEEISPKHSDKDSRRLGKSQKTANTKSPLEEKSLESSVKDSKTLGKSKKAAKSLSPIEEKSSENSEQDSKALGKSPKAAKSISSKEEKSPKKAKRNTEEELMLKIIKDMKAKKEKKAKEKQKAPVVVKIADLPTIKIKEPIIKVTESISGSVLECDINVEEIKEMIEGTEIVPFVDRNDADADFVQPILFRAATVFSEPISEVRAPDLPQADSFSEKDKKPASKTKAEEKVSASILSYKLSNKEFIEKGWTVLPTTRMVRRMNIYKMIPLESKFDWFKKHKTQRVIQYDSGEKLAEIERDGSGKLFYKNGNVALVYCRRGKYNSSADCRYIVYSSGDNSDAGKKLPVTVLACFDFRGNGVIYDHYGNERLKYNQSEGVVFDDKIGPPGKWKWHTLNEPPDYQTIFLDNYVTPDPCLQKFVALRQEIDTTDSNDQRREPDPEMVAIELDMLYKLKVKALSQKFKPFKIRMKALKLNDQFSVKVIDQANISLMFRDSHTSIKFDVGMVLVSSEIVDTDVSEVAQVATPYDHRPPKSENIAEIQTAIEKARRLGRARGKLRD